jgi:hypothetical protein
MNKDHIMAEVRRNGEKLSERFDNNPDKLFEHFKEEEKKSKTRVRNFQTKKKRPATR